MTAPPTYAVHLGDLVGMQQAVPFVGLLFRSVVTPNSQVVAVDGKRFDGVALTLDCEEEQAQAIIALAREHYSRDQFRLYKRDRVWKRI